MVLHNPNNWHWVNKDVSAWAKEYLDKVLLSVSAEDNGASAKIEKVVSMDGDVDVSQRKGKVITLFDVKVRLEYSGLFCRSELQYTGELTCAQERMPRARKSVEASLFRRLLTTQKKMSMLYVP